MNPKPGWTKGRRIAHARRAAANDPEPGGLAADVRGVDISDLDGDVDLQSQNSTVRLATIAQNLVDGSTLSS